MPQTGINFLSVQRKIPGVGSSGRNVTTVFEEAQDFAIWTKVEAEQTIVLVDKNVLPYHTTSLALRAARSRGCLSISEIPGGEPIKQMSFYQHLRKQWITGSPQHLILIGGGSLINLGLYVASELTPGCDGKGPGYCSIIPTNTMAIADVALGGLGMLNDARGRKNVFRKCRDPDWIFLFSDYVINSTGDLRREGIVEVLKHAILQDNSFIDSIASLYLSPIPDSAESYSAAKRGLHWKSELMGKLGQWSGDDIEFLLSFGHLHAHVIEEIWKGKVSHSPCVFIGILMDLVLAGYYDLVSRLLKITFGSPLLQQFRHLLAESNIDIYLKAYPTSGKFAAAKEMYFVANVGPANIGSIVNSHGIYLTKLVRSIVDIRHAYSYLAECVRNTKVIPFPD